MSEEIKETVLEDAAEETATDKKKECSSGKKADKDSKKIKKELEETAKALSEKEAAYEELNDKYMRVLAEYDNFRRRTQKEREGIYSDAYSDAISNILPIYDNMERAVQFADGDKVSEGVVLIMKGFADSLEKMGITEIPALGEQFDPEVHNAVMHVEDESYGENEVIEVLQKGYRRGDKIIRFAMVKVAN
ncbi:MAG: nucleotide exchange factor GrpE [Clostridia bacterium]|nr:nucleotide exchange factor GrpE [Clostridia bacterium]